MISYKIHHFKSLPSTQEKAKEFSRKGLSNVVIIADTQTKGKGRFKRKWYSTKGGLWMSILLKPKNTENLQYLTFAVAVAVLKSIKKISSIDTKIKWPNDVHYKGKKLCGILTEGIFGNDNFVVVGIGLNINQLQFPGEIKETATSLRKVKRRIYDISNFAKSILDEFYFNFENYYNKNKPGKIMKAWKQHCDTLNRNVKIMTKTRTLHGKAIDVDKDCNLILELKNGKTVKIIEGDVKVRY